MLAIHWRDLFTFTVSPVELFIRGSAVYLFVLIVMRILRREAGTVAMTDLLMVVLIADAAQNAMAASYQSILDGLILILTIVFWNFFLDWLSMRSEAVERFVYPSPIALYKDHEMNRPNMAGQFITEQQLYSMLRQHGVDDTASVKAVYLEGNGRVSVILEKDTEQEQVQEFEERVS